MVSDIIETLYKTGTRPENAAMVIIKVRPLKHQDFEAVNTSVTTITAKLLLSNYNLHQHSSFCWLPDNHHHILFRKKDHTDVCANI